MKKIFTEKEITRILKANEFIAVSCRGSHIKYYKESTKESFVLTTQKGVNPMIWRRIVKEYSINIYIK